MKNWIIFNIVLLMAGAASAQVRMAAAHSQAIGFPSAAQSLREPASKPVPKITNDDEISGEMDAANASAQATYRKRNAQLEQSIPAQEDYRPAQQPVQPPVRKVAPRPAKTVQQQIDEGDYNPYKAPVRQASKKPARPQPQTQVVYKQAYAEQPRVQVAPAPAPAPRYHAQPAQLSPVPSQNPAMPVGPAVGQAGYPAEQDWRPAVRRTGLTLLPTLNLGMGTTSADLITDSVMGVSVQHQSKFIYGGGLMAEFGRSTFTFESGFLYVTEAINSSYSTNSFYTTSNNATLGFMGVPLLAKVNFSVIPHRSRLSISGGVIPAVLVYSDFRYSSPQGAGFQRDITDPKDNGLGLGGFRTFNVFGTAAIGGDFTVGSQSDVRAELAYRRALMSLTQNQNTFEDVFLVNLSFGFDVNLFSHAPVAPAPQYQVAPAQAR